MLLARQSPGPWPLPRPAATTAIPTKALPAMRPHEAQLSPESSRASFTELLPEDLSEFFAAAASLSEDREQDATPDEQPPKAPTLQALDMCRTYVAAFEAALRQDADVRTALAAALSPTAVMEAFAGVNLEGVLNVENAHVCLRESSGYRPWLFFPEPGMRGLVRDCLRLCQGPMEGMISKVQAALLAGAEAAARRCGEAGRATGAGAGRSLEQLQGEESLLGWMHERAKQRIKSWREETLRQLEAVLESECAFPSPAGFAGLKAQLMLNGKDDKALVLAKGGRVGACTTEEEDLESVQASSEYREFFMGYLEKLSRHGAWQKRWFVLAEEKQCMYYFKHPDDVSARAVVNLRGVQVISEVDSRTSGIKESFLHMGLNAVTGKSTQHAHVFQLQLPSGLYGNAVMASITLRCPDEAARQQWIARIQAASHMHVAEAKPAPGGASMIPRKITTMVYPDEEPNPLAGSASCFYRTSSEEENVGEEEQQVQEEAAEEEEGDPEEAALREAGAALVRQLRAAAAGVSPRERATLEHVVKEAGAYVKEAHSRLADLCGKVVASGMTARGEDLYADLLGVLLPQEGWSVEGLLGSA